MSAPANGLTRAQPDPLASLAQRLPDPQDREWYAQLVAYIQSLPANDELVKIAQLFGFLTLLGRELPGAIAAEQDKMREFLLKAYGALQQEVKINESYHQKLHERLSKLPEEIAEGVKPEAIAKTMSESFRQQLVATGIGDVQALLAQSTRDLKRVTGEFDKAVQPIVSKYGSIAGDIQEKVNALSVASGRLEEAARSVDRRNATLLKEIRQLDWWIVPSVGVALLLAGAFFGFSWEQRHVTDSVLELQNQIQQLQQSIKTLPAVLIPPPQPKKHKKGT